MGNFLVENSLAKEKTDGYHGIYDRRTAGSSAVCSLRMKDGLPMRFPKTLPLLIICMLLPVCLMASSDYIPTSNDVNTSLQAIIDATMSAVASYLASPSFQLPGCDIEAGSGKALPSMVTFRDSDLSQYLPVLRPETPESGSWLQRFLSKVNAAVSSPMASTAASLLENNGWRIRDAVLNGSLELWFPDGASVASLMALLVTPRPGETIATAAVDVVLVGERFGGPVHIEGDFLLEVPQRGTLTVTPEDLTANGLVCQGGRIRIGMGESF